MTAIHRGDRVRFTRDYATLTTPDSPRGLTGEEYKVHEVLPIAVVRGDEDLGSAVVLRLPRPSGERVLQYVPAAVLSVVTGPEPDPVVTAWARAVHPALREQARAQEQARVQRAAALLDAARQRLAALEAVIEEGTPSAH